MRSLQFLNKILAVLLVVALVACVADTATLAAGKGDGVRVAESSTRAPLTLSSSSPFHG